LLRHAPLAASALRSLATDHSGRAGALRIRLVADYTGTYQDLYFLS